MRSSRHIVFAALAVLVSLGLALAAAEWIAFELLRHPGERKAAAAGMEWDRRDRLDVIVEARRSDPSWYPAVPANTYLERPLLLEGQRVVPLGGVALANVVGCNESGYFSAFATDEHGFNNPRGVLAVPGRRLFFVGDSYTQGDCLRAGETIVDRVRARHPATVNLGSGGNGPLFQLAAIREYVSPAAAPLVLWMYYEGNDLEDLRRDRRDSILARYLEPSFSQRLASRQPALDRAVRAMVDARLEERLEGRASVLPSLRLLAWQARQNWSFTFTPAVADSNPGSDDVLELFVEVLALARDEVAAKGGSLVFVYLPEYYRYAGPRLSPGAARRDAVLEAVRGVQLPIVDLHAALGAHADPVQLFPFGLKGHYSTAGAQLAAQAILDFIERHP